jgi:hypothetical protein
LLSNIGAGANTAVGSNTLVANTAARNTATGASALENNTTGFNNTANGFQALNFNDDANNNTATGAFSLSNNTSGDDNTATGVTSLNSNTSGGSNTAFGFSALLNNTTGFENIGVGHAAGQNVVTANHVIAIGANALDVSNSCFIGQIYTNVQPQVGIDPDLVTINSSGRLGRANVSSRRYKHDIQPMHTASETIYSLRPVSFRYHKEYDQTQTIAFGLIAEEVAEVNPDLVGRNREGQPESVRYEQINAMLLNEFLKEHRKGEEQDCKIQQQESTIAELTSEIRTLATKVNEQASQLQQMSAQLQINDAAAKEIAQNP